MTEPIPTIPSKRHLDSAEASLRLTADLKQVKAGFYRIMDIDVDREYTRRTIKITFDLASELGSGNADIQVEPDTNRQRFMNPDPRLPDAQQWEELITSGRATVRDGDLEKTAYGTMLVLNLTYPETAEYGIQP